MRRTPTLRALATATGVAALLSAGPTALAGTADEDDYPPFGSRDWDAWFEDQGYADVSCLVSIIPVAEGRADVVQLVDSAWSPRLDPGHEYVGVVLRADGEEEPLPFSGYGHANAYAASGDGDVSHVLVCQARAARAVGPQSTDAPDPPPDEQPDAQAGGVTDGPGRDAVGDDNAVAPGPSGPPVETDGPRDPSGPDRVLVGGAALLLAGAGAAGLALRRREGAAER